MLWKRVKRDREDVNKSRTAMLSSLIHEMRGLEGHGGDSSLNTKVPTLGLCRDLYEVMCMLAVLMQAAFLLVIERNLALHSSMDGNYPAALRGR